MAVIDIVPPNTVFSFGKPLKVVCAGVITVQPDFCTNPQGSLPVINFVQPGLPWKNHLFRD
jgi:hypothetical protein